MPGRGAYSTKYTYDYAGRVLSETDIEGKTSYAEYNYLGQLVKATDKCGFYSQMDYDMFGNLSEKYYPQIAPRGDYGERYSYDRVGNLSYQSISCRDSQRGTTYHYYNNRNFLTITFGPNGGRFSYQYDEAGNVTYFGSTDVEFNRSTTYNRFNKPLTAINSLRSRETYYYNAVGVLQSKIDYNGNTTTYTYNGAYQVLTETVKDSAGVVTAYTKNTYSKNLQKLSCQNARLTTTYSYDKLGRIVKETDSNGVVKEYEYNLGECKKYSLTVSGRKEAQTDYSYNRLGQPETTVESTGGIVVSTKFTYDAVGRRKTMEYGGLKAEYIYDIAGRMTTLNYTKGTSLLESWQQEYYYDGNVKKVKKNGKDYREYTYDLAGQLTTETMHAPLTEIGKKETVSYCYDKMGNRTAMKVQSENTSGSAEEYSVEYTYGAENRLLQERKVYGKNCTDKTKRGTRYYEYDNNGNQITCEREIHRPITGPALNKVFFRSDEEIVEIRRYNGYNQVVYIFKDSTSIDLDYRPDGLRHSKCVDGGTTTTHIWQGQNIVAETTANGIKARYLRGAGLIAQVTDGNAKYYLHNYRGDVTALTDTHGTLLKKYDYDAFGNEITANSANNGARTPDTDPNPFRYCGEYYDKETKTVYLRARNYNPRTGRFTSEDPAKHRTNWYAYCSGNPVAFKDSSRLREIIDDPRKDGQNSGNNAIATAQKTAHIASKQATANSEKTNKEPYPSYIYSTGIGSSHPNVGAATNDMVYSLADKIIETFVRTKYGSVGMVSSRENYENTFTPIPRARDILGTPENPATVKNSAGYQQTVSNAQVASVMGLGLAYMNAVGVSKAPVGSAARTNDSTTKIYRSVGAEEYSDIAKTKQFNLSLKSMQCKQFGLDISDIQKFANWDKSSVAIIESEISTNILNEIGDFTPVDTTIFKSGNVTIHSEFIEIFNKFVTINFKGVN